MVRLGFFSVFQNATMSLLTLGFSLPCGVLVRIDVSVGRCRSFIAGLLKILGVKFSLGHLIQQ
jgi:ABC-type xylose transport system permease subunit